MIFVDFVFALLVAVLLSLLLIPLTTSPRREGGPSLGAAILFTFLILFLATWAGGLWFTQLGPPLWGGYWLTFVLVGIFVALLLAAAIGPPRRSRNRSRVELVEREEADLAIFGIMFWVLLFGLFAAVIVGYTVR